MVIVSSDKIANDLLRDRGHIYSSRPYSPMGGELVSRHLRPAILAYGPAWRAGRKLSHATIGPLVAGTYEHVQEEHALRLVLDLLRAPSDYGSHFERYAAGIIMRIVFGVDLRNDNDQRLVRMKAVFDNVVRALTPNAYLVNTFPILMRLPSWLAPFKRLGARLHAEEYDLFSGLVHDVERRADSGDTTVQETVTKRWLDTRGNYGSALTDSHAYYVLGTMVEGSVGSTSAEMAFFLLAMVLHPEKLDKLATELDSVMGTSASDIDKEETRVPRLSDLPRLPYLRACMKETLRWRPTIAGGLTHMNTVEDVYEGYRIPKGSLVRPIQWAIHQDPSLYPSPTEFLPERWLDPAFPTYKAPLTEFPNLQNFSAFGYGRRICPGQYVASRSLMIQAMMIVWACDIRVARDINGKQMWPDSDAIAVGFNAKPEKFEFELRPRKGRERIVHREWEQILEKRAGDGTGSEE
jgi:cytochrome P450